MNLRKLALGLFTAALLTGVCGAESCCGADKSTTQASGRIGWFTSGVVTDGAAVGAGPKASGECCKGLPAGSAECCKSQANAGAKDECKDGQCKNEKGAAKTKN
jgi:hypothetical protein